MLRDPTANAVIYRKVAATLRESVFEQMLWAIERLGWARTFAASWRRWSWNTCRRGSACCFRGADDAGKSKSIKLARAGSRFCGSRNCRNSREWPTSARFARAYCAARAERRCSIPTTAGRAGELGQRRGAVAASRQAGAREHVSGRAGALAGRRLPRGSRGAQTEQRARLPPHVPRRGDRHRRAGVREPVAATAARGGAGGGAGVQRAGLRLRSRSGRVRAGRVRSAHEKAVAAGRILGRAHAGGTAGGGDRGAGGRARSCAATAPSRG